MVTHARQYPAAAVAGLGFIAATPALADGPAQTAYDAEFYFLLDSGDIVTGSLAYGIGDPIAKTELGPLASGLEFAPDGRLLCTGGDDIGFTVVASIDLDTGEHEVILTQSDVGADLPGLYIVRGITTAPDNTIYLYAQILVPDGTGSFDFVFDVAHYNAAGEFLGTARVKNPDGSDASWISHSMAVRDDGMIFSAESLRRNYGIIDPTTGELTILGQAPPDLEKWYGLTSVGSTIFANLGVHGEHVYTVEPYTGDLTFVATISGLIPGASGFGFAMLPDPCAADMTYDEFISTEDIQTFVDAFLAGSTAADLDYDRTRTVDDIEVFVDSFLSGCDD